MNPMQCSVKCFVAEVAEGLFISKYTGADGFESFGTTESIWDAYWCGDNERLIEIAAREFDFILKDEFPKTYRVEFGYDATEWDRAPNCG